VEEREVAAITALLTNKAYGYPTRGRRMAALAPGAPELEETIEPRPSRTAWAGTERT
jgi:hypothetical protein